MSLDGMNVNDIRFKFLDGSFRQSICTPVIEVPHRQTGLLLKNTALAKFRLAKCRLFEFPSNRGITYRKPGNQMPLLCQESVTLKVNDICAAGNCSSCVNG